MPERHFFQHRVYSFTIGENFPPSAPTSGFPGVARLLLSQGGGWSEWAWVARRSPSGDPGDSAGKSRVCPGLSPRCPSRRSKPASRLSWFRGHTFLKLLHFLAAILVTPSSERRDRGTDGGREIEKKVRGERATQRRARQTVRDMKDTRR